MKTAVLFGLAVVCVVWSVGLPGCSSDEGDGSADGGAESDGGSEGDECKPDSVRCKAGETEACFDSDIDCDTVMKCGSRYWGCETGKQGYCSSYDVLVCCGGDSPTFCEIPDEFIGCLKATSDCSTGVDCGDKWSFCPTGMRPNCSTGTCDPG
jgi:hypothetical protein